MTATTVGTDQADRRFVWLLAVAGGVAYALGRRHGRRALVREVTEFDGALDEDDILSSPRTSASGGDLDLGLEEFDDEEIEGWGLESGEFDGDFDEFGDGIGGLDDEQPAGTEDAAPEAEGTEAGGTDGGVVAGFVLLSALAVAARRALRRRE